MTPNGVANSKFRHKCLAMSAQRFAELSFAAMVGYAYESYQTSFRDKNQNPGILSIANMNQYAWEVGNPVGRDEELALSFLTGGIYEREEIKYATPSLIISIGEKIGINTEKDPSIGLKMFGDGFAAVTEYWENNNSVALEIDAATEFQPKVSPQAN